MHKMLGSDYIMETYNETEANMGTLHERIRNDYIVNVGLDYGIVELKPFDGKFYFERLGR